MLVFFTSSSRIYLIHFTTFRISGRVFGLISSFVINRQLWVVLGRKSVHKYLVHAGVSQGSILRPTPFLLSMNYLPDGIISTTLDTTLDDDTPVRLWLT